MLLSIYKMKHMPSLPKARGGGVQEFIKKKMTGQIHSSAHVYIKTLGEEEKGKRRRKRREGRYCKRFRKNNCQICRLELCYIVPPPSVMQQQRGAVHSHALPLCQHTTRGAQ